MRNHIITTFLQYALVLWVAVTLNFALPRLMPGNPLALLAGEDVGLLTPDARAEILARYRLDQPVWRQYISYMGDLARGEWGYSYQQKRPVTTILAERVTWTLLLTGTGLFIATTIGVLLGMVAAWYRGRTADVGLLSLFIVLDALPTFWVGMVFIALFAVNWGWFPTFGAYTSWQRFEGSAQVMDILHHLGLPLATLVLASVTGNFVITRYALMEVMRQPYVLVARAKGVSSWRLLTRHILPNAWLPIITVFMLNLGAVLGGTTVIETVFAYPGLGRLLFEAVRNRDYPVIQAAFLLITVSILVVNLLTDMLYMVADPRLRRGGQR